MTAPASPFGVVSPTILASMSGLDFVRKMFAGELPQPPIMENVGPIDCTADHGHVIFHSIPGIRH